MHVARDLAGWRLRTAAGLQWADFTVALESEVAKRMVRPDGAGGRQEVACRAHIGIPPLVEDELLPAQRAVLALRLVDDRDMRFDLFVVDQPVERRRRSVGRIGRQSLGLHAEAVFGPVDHGLRRADLRLANGARGFDIHDDAALHIDQIVVGVSEERRTAHRARPLSSGIGRRDELRSDIGGGAKRVVIEGGKILLHGAARGRGITRLAPLRARDRTLLVGVRRYQARIDREPFAAHQACPQARLDDPLEHAPENPAVAKPFVTGTRERRMVGDLVLDAQSAEPAIGKVDLHFTARRPLRANGRHPIPIRIVRLQDRVSAEYWDCGALSDWYASKPESRFVNMTWLLQPPREGVVSNTQRGAEVILELLRTNGIDCVFASPIAVMAPLWEALAGRRQRGDPEVPRYIQCRHETIAVAAASGYYKATGRPQAVFLPTGLGVLHGAMALRTALQERTPMTVISPDTLTYGEIPSFDPGPEWPSLLVDFAGPARDGELCVKWAKEAKTEGDLVHELRRALYFAEAIPKGPTLVSVPFDLMMSPIPFEE